MICKIAKSFIFSSEELPGTVLSRLIISIFFFPLFGPEVTSHHM